MIIGIYSFLFSDLSSNLNDHWRPQRYTEVVQYQQDWKEGENPKSKDSWRNFKWIKIRTIPLRQNSMAIINQQPRVVNIPATNRISPQQPMKRIVSNEFNGSKFSLRLQRALAQPNETGKKFSFFPLFLYLFFPFFFYSSPPQPPPPTK